MNAAETIQAAIDKLEAQRTERRYFESNGWLVEDAGTDVAPLTDDELIVTLHRTIDAQLAILRAILKVHLELVPLPFDDHEVWPIPATAYDLARAILGDQP